MIITRTPLRLPLGGGGTDLPAYYTKYGGAWTSAAIDKHVYIIVNPRFEPSIRISYSQTEIVDDVDSIRHPIVREALRLLAIERHIEIVSIADLPANTGLGSSGSFTVGLLHALHTYKREPVSPTQLAEEAFRIEAEILGEPVGKQDQYIGACGGITHFTVDRGGRVEVEQVTLDRHFVQEFQHRIMLFSTGVRRAASKVLDEQRRDLESGGAAAARLRSIEELGRDIRAALTCGDLRRFGELLHLHWETKRGMTKATTSAEIDRWYEVARANGALGGKLIGAGGGGFFIFYCEDADKRRLRDALAQQGLSEVRYAIDFDGTKVVLNI